MRALFCLFFLTTFSLSYGQFKEPKFGKLEPSELTMTRYEKDTTADALMLFDNGNTRFNLNTERKFQFIFERHFRIKIFKKSAFNLANFKFNLYKSNSSKEVIKELKAFTYNMVDGKIVKSKVEKENIFEEDSKNSTVKKLAFPEVREGSIIELSYSITSDFLYNLRDWNFQYHIPALWSQYCCIIPEYFNYRHLTKGYLPFEINKEEQNSTDFTILSEAKINSALTREGRTPSEYYNIKATTTEITLATKDVPAFISEPNIDCEENYMSAVQFELRSIQYPNDLRKDYTHSWESVNKEMSGDDEFGVLLKSKGFINDTVLNLCKNKITEIEKATSIYNYVQKRMKWNGNYSLWSRRGLKKPFSERSGNSSEINLLLTLMLQTAGLNANPVMFSTRDNGYELDFYPTMSKYNSVMSKLDIDGKSYLLDATNEFCPMGTLPANDINGKGRVVNELAGDWVDLDSQTKYKEVKSYALNIQPDGKFAGTVIGNYSGYAGVNYRKYLSQEKTNDDYIRKAQENLKGLAVKKYSITDRYDISKNLIDTMVVEITDHADILGDKILFQPLLFEALEKNKYTLEDRKYPVNYNYPISETYVFDYTIPNGYEVESLPQTKLFKLQDNSINATYSIQSLGNKITVIFKRNINKIMFLPDEYMNLKEFYNQIVKKHSEQIILEKTA